MPLINCSSNTGASSLDGISWNNENIKKEADNLTKDRPELKLFLGSKRITSVSFAGDLWYDDMGNIVFKDVNPLSGNYFKYKIDFMDTFERFVVFN